LKFNTYNLSNDRQPLLYEKCNELDRKLCSILYGAFVEKKHLRTTKASS